MAKMISMCGLVCSECGAYTATQADDDEQRKKVAEEWTQAYHADIKPEDINCDGCTSGSERIFHYPRVCEIRACGLKHKVKNCGHCPEYDCEKLNKFFEIAPQAKKTLEDIRRTL
jgi:carbonic anhydrase